jgi:hypothetical protein
VINGHIAAKSIYLRMFAGTDRIHKRDWVAVGSWIGIMAVLWTISWIIAEAIPVFNDLIGLIVSDHAACILEVNLRILGFTVFELVYLWPARSILAVYEQGDVVLVAGEDFLDRCQRVLGVYWADSGRYIPSTDTALRLIDQCALGLYASGVSIHKNPAGSVFSCGARS